MLRLVDSEVAAVPAVVRSDSSDWWMTAASMAACRATSWLRMEKSMVSVACSATRSPVKSAMSTDARPLSMSVCTHATHAVSAARHRQRRRPSDRHELHGQRTFAAVVWEMYDAKLCDAISASTFAMVTR